MAPTVRTGAGVVLLVALAGLTAIGCQRRGTFDRVHFETLYYGQPDYAVERTLGPPSQRQPDSWVYIHARPYYRAEIHFEDGRLSEKLWFWTRPSEPRPAPPAAAP